MLITKAYLWRYLLLGIKRSRKYILLIFWGFFSGGSGGFFPTASAARERSLDVFHSAHDFRAGLFCSSVLKKRKEPISCVTTNRGWSHHLRGYKTPHPEHFCQDPSGKVEGKRGKPKRYQGNFKNYVWKRLLIYQSSNSAQSTCHLLPNKLSWRSGGCFCRGYLW